MRHSSTILIVDDEPVGRETLQALLMAQGYNLTFASSGAEALAKVAELVPDLILLDVMMPDIDGFEVCQRLRVDPLLAEVPVIIVTALDDRNSRLRGIEVGADDFVTKPFDRAELRARVRTITRLNRYRRLLAERTKFKWVVEKAADGYLIVNDSGKVLYANPQARLYLDLPVDESEAISEKFLAVIRKQYRCEPQEAWATWPEQPAIATQSPRYLVRPESPTANTFWLQVDILDLPSGPEAGWIVRLRDVTTHVVEQRMMWTFHGQINHKLRTPLAHLTSFLEVLQKDQSKLSDAKKKGFLSAAYQGAMRLRDEVEDILQYVGAPDMVRPDQERCDLTAIPSVAAEVSSSLELKSTHISYEGLEDLDDAYVPISRQLMELVLWELFENAKRFHPGGLPTVEVKISDISDGVRIRICDDGLTLSPDQLAKLWVPYYQAEKRFTGEVPGMGLGLPTVATLVWGVGGTCRAYNREEGPGLVVELVLPLVRSNGGADE
jgi:two-component system cell cycle response regulator